MPDKYSYYIKIYNFSICKSLEEKVITISLCMIVKNEEMVLSRCLESIKDIVDEIIIIDTGSTDKTKEIARLYTDKVYDFKWTQDFSQARNYSFSKATKDYQMWLDAEEGYLKEKKNIYGMTLYTNILNLEVIYITPMIYLYPIKKKLPIHIGI